MARRQPARLAVKIPAPGEARRRIRALACNKTCEIRADLELPRISDWLQEPNHLLWLDIRDSEATDLEMLREEFGFHPLSLEDAAKQQQRPKVDEYPGYYFVVTYALAGGEGLPTEVDLFIGPNYVVTTHPGCVPALDDAWERWQRGGELLREGVGFLVYTIMDALIDGYFPAVDQIEDRIDDVEEGIFTQFRPEVVRELLQLKRRLFQIRRVLFPLRETFNVFLRRDRPVFAEGTYPYFQDVYDHVLRLLDIVDIQRDMITGTLDAYLTVISNRLNAVMKTLTAMAIAVATAGLVFGAFGMNVGGIPGAHDVLGFWIVFAGTVALVVVALLFAWWRRWL